MRVGKVLIGLLMLGILLALVAFAVWNPAQQLNVNILGNTYERVPFVYTIFIAFLAGVALTLIFGFLYYCEMAISVRRLRNEKKALEAELTTLRNLPLEEEVLEPSSKGE
ncbi:MAG: LapA family protein [Candidatus Eisenbacteria sp.]|nr:LapA family protein [Candidatus Eisenbacteria bacterium]